MAKNIRRKRKRNEEIFDRVTTENFPRLTSDTKPDIQEAHRTPTKINAKKKKKTVLRLRLITFKLKKIKDRLKKKFKILEKRGKNILPIEEER